MSGNLGLYKYLWPGSVYLLISSQIIVYLKIYIYMDVVIRPLLIRTLFQLHIDFIRNAGVRVFHYH